MLRATAVCADRWRRLQRHFAMWHQAKTEAKQSLLHHNITKLVPFDNTKKNVDVCTCWPVRSGSSSRDEECTDREIQWPGQPWEQRRQPEHRRRSKCVQMSKLTQAEEAACVQAPEEEAGTTPLHHRQHSSLLLSALCTAFWTAPVSTQPHMGHVSRTSILDTGPGGCCCTYMSDFLQFASHCALEVTQGSWLHLFVSSSGKHSGWFYQPQMGEWDHLNKAFQKCLA